MRNWIIKLLGGYTGKEFRDQANMVYLSERQVKHVLWLVSHQQEKLEGALIRLFNMYYPNNSDEAYRLAKSYSEEIKERTNRRTLPMEGF